MKISIVRVLSASLLIPFFQMWGAVGSVFIYRIYMNFVISKEIKKYYIKE